MNEYLFDMEPTPWGGMAAAAMRLRLAPGVRIWWNHRALGRCMGSVRGVWPLGVTAQRDDVQRRKPHFLKWHQVNLLPGSESPMLVISRRVDESVRIVIPASEVERTVSVQVLKTGSDRVMVGFEADRDVAIDRSEVPADDARVRMIVGGYWKAPSKATSKSTSE